MFSKTVLAVIAAAILVPVARLAAQAQGGGQVGMPSPEPDAPQRALAPPTLFQQFVGRLKLDKKTQAPAAEQIFGEALKEAGPVGQQMILLRQQLVNVTLANKPEDLKPVQDAYTVAAARMTAIEVGAFAKVYAMLKPDQQSRSPEAFAIMAGVFQPPGPRAGGAIGRRGGGRP